MYQNLASILNDLPIISFPKISKQAFSKARQAVNPSLFKDLFHLSVDLFYKNFSKRKTWHDYHLFAIDGSKFELPNSKSNFEFFGEMFGYPDPSRRFTMGLASIVYDVLDDYIVHASFHRYLASERRAALEHLKNLEALDIFKNSIVIFDRGYYSEDLFRYCVSHGHCCLIRLKENLKISKSCNGDTISILVGNPKKGTADIKIRVIEVTLDDGSKEYLATNVFDTTLTSDMFRELYFLRWPVETKYLELKKRLEIESFSGATTTSIFQEFYLNMLFSNLSALIKNHVDEILDNSANPANKYRYQANRSFIIGQLKKTLPKILCKMLNVSAINDIVDYAFITRSQIQPGRSYPRKKNKAIGRTHFNNMKPSF
ncbi:MAG: IS4 family transposase [Vallitaleaceae bacterium]|nr:IS4 family transposase [Vallitaleaceae bacterium]